MGVWWGAVVASGVAVATSGTVKQFDDSTPRELVAIPERPQFWTATGALVASTIALLISWRTREATIAEWTRRAEHYGAATQAIAATNRHAAKSHPALTAYAVVRLTDCGSSFPSANVPSFEKEEESDKRPADADGEQVHGPPPVPPNADAGGAAEPPAKER